MSSTTFYRRTGLTVYQISNILEGKVKLPEITSITLIPNDDNQAGTDEDSDYDENLEPKSMDRFGRGILNSMAEIDFLDEDEELAYLVVLSFLNPINVCGLGFSNAIFFTLLYASHFFYRLVIYYGMPHTYYF